jgi:peptidoglycan/xylan/chitin deacetylase (PgdA/CDA1 family)
MARHVSLELHSKYWWKAKAWAKEAVLSASSGSASARLYGRLQRRRKRVSLLPHGQPLALPAYPNNVVEGSDVPAADELCRRRRTVVALNECIDGLEMGRRGNDGIVALTFDDGYKSCLQTVAPLLQQYGFPATFFISPGFIDRRQPKWDDWLYFAMKPFDKRVLRSGKSEVDRILQQLEPAEDSEMQVVKAACAASLLTWEDVRSLHDMGYSVQSHGLNHYYLSAQTPDDQAVEIAGAKQRLEETLGADVRFLAYPFGSKGCFSTETQMLARRAGYAAAFTGESGYVEDSRDRFSIRRMTIGRDTPFWKFKLILSGLYF